MCAWFSIFLEKPFVRLVKAAQGLRLYREQMVGEAVIGVNTAEHWSRINPQQAKPPFDANLTNDVNERLGAAALEEKEEEEVG